MPLHPPTWSAPCLYVVAATVLTACAGGCDTSRQSVGADVASAESKRAMASLAACPPVEKQHVDSLRHLGRGEGDDFVEILDVVSTPELAYVCTGTQGLSIWNLKPASRPTLLSENVGPDGLSHEKFPRCQHVGLDASAKRVAITNRGDEVQQVPFIQIYDVSDARRPEPVAGWSGHESIEGVALHGDRVIAAAHRDGLLLLERKKDRLVEVGRFRDKSSNAWMPVRIQDSAAHEYVLVAEGETGLRSYRLEGNRLKLASTVALPGSSKDVAVRGTTAYVATSTGVSILDVSDPAKLRVLGEIETPGTALAVAPVGDDAIAIADWSTVLVVDVSDPKSPRIEGSETVPTQGTFSRVLALDALDDGRILAGEWEGFHVLELGPRQPAPDIDLPATHFAGRVAAGTASTISFEVHNRGGEPLVITDIRSTNPALSPNKRQLTIPPRSSAELRSTLRPTSDEASNISLRLCSDDPDEPSVSVDIWANRPEVEVGDPAPEFDLVDLDGKRWSSRALRGKVLVLSYFATF